MTVGLVYTAPNKGLPLHGLPHKNAVRSFTMRRHVKRDVDKPLDAAAREVGGDVSQNKQNPLDKMDEVVTSFMARSAKLAGTWSKEEAKQEIASCMTQVKACLVEHRKQGIDEVFARLRSEPMTNEEIVRIFLTPPLEVQMMSPSERIALNRRIYKEALEVANKG